MIVTRKCGCGRSTHPVYGGVCEDCWAAAQPTDGHARVRVVRTSPAAAGFLRLFAGLCRDITDDGARDQPRERTEQERRIPLPASIFIQ